MEDWIKHVGHHDPMRFHPSGPPVPLIIAGPCTLESYECGYEVASELKKLSQKFEIPIIFKSSYDKANRNSHKSPRGPGRIEGLKILARIREEIDIPVLCDVHETQDVQHAAHVADVLQIPAFLCRQTDLLQACAQSGRIVNIKKGPFLSPSNVKNLVEKSHAAGGKRVLITERGTSFGYNDLVVDFRSLPLMRQHAPVILDGSHAAQSPGSYGDRSGGNRDHVPILLRAAAAVGVTGFFFETFPEPHKAASDPDTQLSLYHLEGLLKELIEIWNVGIKYRNKNEFFNK